MTSSCSTTGASLSSSEGWRTPPGAQTAIGLRVVVPPQGDETTSEQDSSNMSDRESVASSMVPRQVPLRRSVRTAAAHFLERRPYSGRGSAMSDRESLFHTSNRFRGRSPPSTSKHHKPCLVSSRQALQRFHVLYSDVVHQCSYWCRSSTHSPRVYLRSQHVHCQLIFRDLSTVDMFTQVQQCWFCRQGGYVLVCSLCRRTAGCITHEGVTGCFPSCSEWVCPNCYKMRKLSAPVSVLTDRPESVHFDHQLRSIRSRFLSRE